MHFNPSMNSFIAEIVLLFPILTQFLSIDFDSFQTHTDVMNLDKNKEIPNNSDSKTYLSNKKNSIIVVI